MVQSAVIYQIQIVGEAVRHLPPAFRQHHAGVPWQDIAGLLSKLVHVYFGIDLEAVWLAATRDLPTLESAIRRILMHWEHL